MTLNVQDPIRNALRDLVRSRTIWAWNARERPNQTTEWTVVLVDGPTLIYDTDGVNKANRHVLGGRVICSRCEMYYPERMMTGEPSVHACPEPWPIDYARSFVQAHASTGIPVHPRQKAACVLAYKAAGLR
jgi:hypothetical protein